MTEREEVKSNYVLDPGHRAPPQEGDQGRLQNTVLCRMTESEVMKSEYNYVLDPDTELLIKRVATAVNRTPCCAG
jgi:hypothetical protein